MAYKTKAELTTSINTLLADNDTGEISEADIRSLLGDVNDTFLRPGNTPVPVAHTNYVGTSDDDTFGVSEYTVSGMSATLTIPIYTGRKFLSFAFPVAEAISAIYLYQPGHRNTVNQLTAFPTTGSAILGGTAHATRTTVDAQFGFGGYTLEMVFA